MNGNRWWVHSCLLDSECRRVAGPTWRIDLNSPWWHLGIALRPGDRFVTKASDGQYRPSWFSFRRMPR
jgi:hypothetical protein